MLTVQACVCCMDPWLHGIKGILWWVELMKDCISRNLALLTVSLADTLVSER